MKTEVRKLKKYGGLYSVSSEGYTSGHRSGKPLKIYFSDGELKVRLLGKMVSVALLVAETFIPRPKGNFLLRHKDGNPYNNRVDNLEWYLKEIRPPLLSVQQTKTKKRRLRGVRATYHLRKRIEVSKKNKYGYFECIDVVLGLNNTARKYKVPASVISKHCQHAKIKEMYQMKPLMFISDKDRKRKERLYKRDKAYKNQYKFRELGY